MIRSARLRRCAVAAAVVAVLRTASSESADRLRALAYEVRLGPEVLARLKSKH